MHCSLASKNYLHSKVEDEFSAKELRGRAASSCLAKCQLIKCTSVLSVSGKKGWKHMMGCRCGLCKAMGSLCKRGWNRCADEVQPTNRSRELWHQVSAKVTEVCGTCGPPTACCSTWELLSEFGTEASPGKLFCGVEILCWSLHSLTLCKGTKAMSSAAGTWVYCCRLPSQSLCGGLSSLGDQGHWLRIATGSEGLSQGPWGAWQRGRCSQGRGGTAESTKHADKGVRQCLSLRLEAPSRRCLLSIQQWYST